MPLFPMTKLVLKWAFRKPATTKYPFEPRKPLAGSRGQLIFTNDNCVYCMLCQKKCPAQAIVVDRTEKTLGIDRLRCVNCGACVEACPKHSLDLTGMHTTATVSKATDVSLSAKPPAAKPTAPPTEPQA